MPRLSYGQPGVARRERFFQPRQTSNNLHIYTLYTSLVDERDDSQKQIVTSSLKFPKRVTWPKCNMLQQPPLFQVFNVVEVVFELQTIKLGRAR